MSFLNIVFVGGYAGQEMQVEDVDEKTTMEYVGQQAMKFLGAQSGKLSFVTDFGDDIRLEVDKNQITGEGKEFLAERITGFFSTGLSCYIKKKVCEILSIPVNDFCLKQDGDKLDEDHSINYYGIDDGDLLEVKSRLCIYCKCEDMGEIIEIPLKFDDTIMKLKTQACKMLSVKNADYQVFFHEVQLDEKKTIKLCNINYEDEIELRVISESQMVPKRQNHGQSTVQKMKSVSRGARMQFVDVEKTDAMISRDFSSSAPDWRVACNGLSIEGKCENSKCPANRRMVIHQSNYGSFNLEESDAKCPLCKTSIQAVKPGFCNCMWRMDYQKVNKSVMKMPWRKSGNKYTTYDETEAGTAEFVRLIIHTKKANTGQEKTIKEGKEEKKVLISFGGICALCHEEKKSVIVTMKCLHSFHKVCSDIWKSRGLNCPICEEEIEYLDDSVKFEDKSQEKEDTEQEEKKDKQQDQGKKKKCSIQ
ncbi:MAG: putative ring and ubiquitin domain containing protein [Streblomastix strix]|uniref:Putative ring and ubiquitin domain containing protein n=1 Tax=Streblomastix strix TaxID=222440 RepID=A0A5J4UB81_9EUKA|nr:MAG: putative ring and ubiquitin domain containing protein [Streblomastix strix]